MRIPYVAKGALFGPAFILLVILLKIICPESAGDGCFANHFALPIFLPLVLLFQLTGWSSMPFELTFVVVYWAAVGALIGAIFDLWDRKKMGPQMNNVQ